MKLLSGSGVPLTEAELDSFMLDAINKRETDFDGVYSRIFAHRELDMSDEARQAVLLNYLEERFEELLENLEPLLLTCHGVSFLLSMVDIMEWDYYSTTKKTCQYNFEIFPRNRKA